MRTRYTYLGANVIEVAIDGESVEVNILPVEQPQREPDLLPAVQPAHVAVDAPPAGDGLACAAPAPTVKRRTLMGTIRAGWFVAFTAAGEALTYALNNLTTLDLPPGTATAVGALGYGVKKAVWPDTTL